MIYQVSNGIQIAVSTSYRPDFSNPQRNEHFFSYRIQIENQSEEIVQLLHRHWFIFDALEGYSEIKGEGVVGLQPILRPGDIHEYESGCNLKSEIGKMHGYYTFIIKNSQKTFKVEIPEFQLIATHLLS
jgi:ApaG protein